MLGVFMLQQEEKMSSESQGRKPIKLSPSTLNLLFECERCFWLEHRCGIPRPRGIYPGLPNAVDRLIKAETAQFAGRGKPLWLHPAFGGVIQPNMTKLRLKTPAYVLSGILDDVITNPHGFDIIDYKTSSRPYTLELAEKYYGLQMDCYALLCETNGFKPVTNAYLVFFTPNESSLGRDHGDFIRFCVTHLKLDVSSFRAKKAIEKAVALCEQEEAPLASPDCAYCAYFETRKNNI